MINRSAWSLGKKEIYKAKEKVKLSKYKHFICFWSKHIYNPFDYTYVYEMIHHVCRGYHNTNVTNKIWFSLIMKKLKCSLPAQNRLIK